MESIERESIRRCELCSKPLASVSSYTRHISYCRRAQTRQRRRPQPCRACRTAKVKCSFENRCARCATKDIECTYERSSFQDVGSAQFVERTSQEPRVASTTNASSLTEDAFSIDTADLLLLPEPGAFLESWTYDFSSAAAHAVCEDRLLTDASHEFLPDALNMTRCSEANHTPQKGQLRYLTCLRSWAPVAQQCSTLIRDALCAIPEQMMRRETLPPFVHSYWHQPQLPEPLAVCMKVSQMFATRTVDVKPFIWRTILSEQRRTIGQLPHLSREDLLPALQAGMVYLIMAVVDHNVVSAAWVREMIVAQSMMCDQFIFLCNGNFCEEEDVNPSLTWDEWVFAESRRRTSCTWFLIARTFVVKTKAGCPTTEQPRTLPLPSSRLQWETRSHADWLRELEFSRPTLRNFGNLIDMKRQCVEMTNVPELNYWNARSDNLGTMLSIATAVA